MRSVSAEDRAAERLSLPLLGRRLSEIGSDQNLEHLETLGSVMLDEGRVPQDLRRFEVKGPHHFNRTRRPVTLLGRHSKFFIHSPLQLLGPPV